MFFDFDQLILLLVLAFILFGPEKLPEYAHKLGRFVAKMREATADISRQCSDITQPFIQAQAPAPAVPPPVVPVCPQCQKNVGADFAFCSHCGQKLKEPPPAPQPGLAS